VRIGQADNLAGVAWISENFLVASKAGIKNNFAAAAGSCARGPSFKDSAVFERENRTSFERRVQWFPLAMLVRTLRRIR
jgi:hypothetical protein